MSEYQYYEFLAVDRPLTTAEQAEVRQLSTRARITATSFTNEYHWGDFKGSPDQLVQHYYDAHLYFANWGTHRIMLRLPRTLLDPKIAGQYCVDGQVRMSTTREHVILDLSSEDEAGEWVEDTEESLSAIVGVRSELAAGDLRPLYLAWLSGYGVWERDEDSFVEEDEDEMEPPVPAGLGSLTARKAPWPTFSASILTFWRSRSVRWGAGSIPAACRICHTVEAAIGWLSSMTWPRARRVPRSGCGSRASELGSGRDESPGTSAGLVPPWLPQGLCVVSSAVGTPAARRRPRRLQRWS
jgi:hypothetical protein